jgi:hypothetical protein
VLALALAVVWLECALHPWPPRAAPNPETALSGQIARTR